MSSLSFSNLTEIKYSGEVLIDSVTKKRKRKEVEQTTVNSSLFITNELPEALFKISLDDHKRTLILLDKYSESYLYVTIKEKKKEDIDMNLKRAYNDILRIEKIQKYSGILIILVMLISNIYFQFEWKYVFLASTVGLGLIFFEMLRKIERNSGMK